MGVLDSMIGRIGSESDNSFSASKDPVELRWNQWKSQLRCEYLRTVRQGTKQIPRQTWAEIADDVAGIGWPSILRPMILAKWNEWELHTESVRRFYQSESEWASAVEGVRRTMETYGVDWCAT